MVLVAIVIMSLTTSTYMLLMRGEHLAARYQGNHLQAKSLVQSGANFLRVFLEQTATEIEQQGGLRDNPDSLQDVLVVEDEMASYRGRFTVLAPAMSQGYYQELRYGLENESAKLNLNSLVPKDEEDRAEDETDSPRDRLLALPGMDEAVADAILDWLDADDLPRSNGAEASYYQTLVPAYQPRNGPIAHLDELLMVQGVTIELLYGFDTNRNYLVDDDELAYGKLEALDNSSGQMNRGWSAYLTVHSLEKNSTSDGEQKLDLNSDNLQTLHGQLESALGKAEANFVIVYRQYGAAKQAVSGAVIGAETLSIDFEKEATTRIESVLDLIDAQVRVEGKPPAQAQTVASPWKDNPESYRQAFADLLDLASVSDAERIAGRININQASLPVLLTLPTMTEALAEQIVASRDPEVDTTTGDQRHPTWLIAEGLVSLEELKPMLPHMTTGGDVYSGQVVGYFESGTARARAALLLDRSGEQTRLLDWKDLSGLGPGFLQSVLSEFAEEAK